MKKFYAVIGNPPYQIEQNGRMLPIYDSFMDEAYRIGNNVELITPARFLFNAGQTKKEWNKKMLSDEHLKVLHYESDSSLYFSNVDIKGGVAITLRSEEKEFGAIGTFVSFDEMNEVISKVKRKEFISFETIVFTSTRYALSNIYEDHPEYREFVKHDGKDSQIDTNAFDKMPIFEEEKDSSGDTYIRVFGRSNNARAYRWVKQKYLSDPGNLYKYKVFVSGVNGSGEFGIALSSPEIGVPGVGSTQSFLAMGAFDSENEAKALLKYMKSKFFRALLCTLKITHHNPPPTWANIPLQDFTSSSDIDWSQPITEIDKQLYKKYRLSKEEIDFIESHVKEMT